MTSPIELLPGERLLWSGRPRSVRRLVIRSVPRAVFGLAIMAFVVFWMVAVALGGHNKWDGGRAVPRFATHNVAIATLAGLWFLPPVLYMVSWPLRTWWRLKKTWYALTDRRAIVGEPGLLGRSGIRSYPAGALGLMRREEAPDGTGDLIFGNPRTWDGMARAVGFLAIDRAREVEDLVRQTLLSGDRPGAGATGPSPLRIARAIPARKTYRVAWAFRLFRHVAFGAGLLMALCILGDLAVVLVVLALRPGLLLAMVPSLERVGVAGASVAGIGSLLGGGFVAWNFFRFALAIPDTITIDEGGTVGFRSRIRTATVPVGDILAIRTGGRLDPGRFQVLVLHRGGKILLINQFPDFMDFLATVKALNPAVDIKGF